MEWAQIIIVLVTLIGLFTWNRAEGRADYRHMDTKLEAMRDLVAAIHEEIKDFHGRLCAIEERRKNDHS